MKWIKIILVTCWLLQLCSGQLKGQATTLPSKNLPVSAWGETIKDVRMRVTSGRKFYTAGDAVDVTVEVENCGKEGVRFTIDRYRPVYFTADLNTEDGGTASKTLYLTRVRPSAFVMSGIKPGGKLSQTVRLNRLYDLTLCDTYLARLEFNFVAVEEGNDKEFTIHAPPQKFKIEE